MHSFSEIVSRSTSFTLSALGELTSRVTEELQTSARTSYFKSLEMIALQKAIVAVGTFSLFEARLQDALNCDHGFKEAMDLLSAAREDRLREQFEIYYRAVNVLKHGRGKSYDALLAQSDSLQFRIRKPDESFFFEGDVSELPLLVEVTDKFVIDCAEVIGDVCRAIRKYRPDFIL